VRSFEYDKNKNRRKKMARKLFVNNQITAAFASHSGAMGAKVK
jgi:hypothetical protein